MSAASLRAIGALSAAPALLTRMSMRPSGANARATAASSVTSQFGAGRVDAVALGDGVALRRQLREIAAEQGEAGAVMGEGVGNRSADAAAAAGDRRVKPGEWPRTRIPQHRVLG